jgi:hypothetical protein
MAITATFTADFSQFSSETKKATLDLDKFEKETLEAGGAITTLATSTDKASKSASSISSAYRQFDGALSAAGINIGPAVKGLEDLAAASGKSVGALGKLATAGLVVGTFTAAFQTARYVIDKWFPDLDDAIAKSVSSFFGWGDVAEQTAGAVADTLARASKEAGREITNINEAVRINTQALKDRNLKLQEQKRADEQSAEALVRVNAELQNHKAVLEAMDPLRRHEIESALRRGASERDVALAYKATASEMAAVTDKVKQHEAALEAVKKKQQELQRQQEDLLKAQAKYASEVQGVIDRVFGTEALNKAALWSDAMKQLGDDVSYLRTAELEELHRTMLEGIDAMARAGILTDEMSSRFSQLAVSAQVALEALKPIVDTTEDLVKAQWDYVTALDAEAAAQREATSAAKQAQEAKGGGFAAGLVPNAIIGRNGVATDMFGRPVVAGGGISQLPVVNISVGGNIIGTEAELARLVGNALTSGYRQGGNRQPV